jgi:hypothetical protein
MLRAENYFKLLCLLGAPKESNIEKLAGSETGAVGAHAKPTDEKLGNLIDSCSLTLAGLADVGRNIGAIDFSAVAHGAVTFVPESHMVNLPDGTSNDILNHDLPGRRLRYSKYGPHHQLR